MSYLNTIFHLNIFFKGIVDCQMIYGFENIHVSNASLRRFTVKNDQTPERGVVYSNE